MSAENKYDDEPRLPTFEEALTEERLLRERSQLMEATKQLAHLRLEMEEKVRREMEEKIRREMEEKMRMEVTRMEEERKKEEERRQLEAMKIERHEKVLAELQRFAVQPCYQVEGLKMMEFAKTHKVICYMKNGGNLDGCQLMTAIYISETQVGVHYLFVKGGLVHQEIRPFYWFDSQLTRRDLALLDNILTTRPPIIHPVSSVPLPLYQSSLQDTQQYLHYKMTKLHRSTDKYHGDLEKVSDFQTILRLIPGGYKNGPWRPLDGFFGPYLNEDTLEIISLIPEAL